MLPYQKALVAAAALSIAGSSLHAQEIVPPADARPVAAAQSTAPVDPVQSLTFNPIGIAAGFYSAEFERRVGSNVSLSLGASYFDLGDNSDNVSYLAGDVRARFYPRRALDGLSIGVSVGLIQTASESEMFDGTGTRDSQNGVTLGTSVEHSWLLGERNNFVFSLGGGFKRILLIDGKQPNVEHFYPTLRTSFGIVF